MTIPQAIEQYIGHMRSLGMKFHSSAAVLRSFARAAGEIEVDEFQAQDVRDFLFAGKTAAQTASQKWSVLRGFYRFAVARHLAAVSPLPVRMPRISQRLIPYIYTEDELRRLIDASALLPRSKLQPNTMQTVLLLLYGAGLRIGEAVRLQTSDVDLVHRLLHVRFSKFYKDRLVPVSDDLAFYLHSYQCTRRCLGLPDTPDAPFLVTDTGDALSVQLADQSFRRLCRLAQVHRNDGGRYQPRLHDLRHSFAVRRVVGWYKQGADVNLMLPRLSTYLGHVQLSYTQHYLTMTPDLLHHASARFESFAHPEVTNERSR